MRIMYLMYGWCYHWGVCSLLPMPWATGRNHRCSALYKGVVPPGSANVRMSAHPWQNEAMCVLCVHAAMGMGHAQPSGNGLSGGRRTGCLMQEHVLGHG